MAADAHNCVFLPHALQVLPGDLIFVLEQKEHPEFKRIGTDLFYEKKVRGGPGRGLGGGSCAGIGRASPGRRPASALSTFAAGRGAAWREAVGWGPCSGSGC